MKITHWTVALIATVLLSSGGWAKGRFAPLEPGARYVAMGSSFAAGPGVTTSADTPPTRCGRSTDNYAQLLARKRGFTLTDVSCSGATTAHILGSWADLAPQIDAVTAETRLVTVTIGGNDLQYLGNLMRSTCHPQGASRLCNTITAPTEDQYRTVEAQMRAIVAETRKRAPAARLVFVDYLTILPGRGSCAAADTNPSAADINRDLAARLVAITARVARNTGTEVLAASRLSRRHDACSRTPWISGFPEGKRPAGTAPYHPNLAGMTAIAKALDQLLGG